MVLFEAQLVSTNLAADCNVVSFDVRPIYLCVLRKQFEDARIGLKTGNSGARGVETRHERIKPNVRADIQENKRPSPRLGKKSAELETITGQHTLSEC
jgi:hypothetical protein